MINDTKKVCFVTGTRADYGLLKPLMGLVNSCELFTFNLIVTGSHLSRDFGYTLKNIKSDGFKITSKIEILSGDDSRIGVSNSIAVGINGFSKAFKKINPDLVVLLGDRYEILSAAISATIMGVPIGHIHGGEVTPNCYDDAIRHSITKMSHLHFVAAREYFNRVVQMGERKKNIFLVGGLGVDCFKSIKILSKAEVEKKLNFSLLKKSLVITYHPVTLERKTAKFQIKEILKAHGSLKETSLIFTMPNADSDNKDISKVINNFVLKNSNSIFYPSLGHQLYFSTISHSDGVVGNSSSGLLEVPSMRKGTVNIGKRQEGRIQASSVFNCKAIKADILRAINLLYSPEGQKNIQKSINPYGNGGAAKKIFSVSKKTRLDNLLIKRFYDIN